MKPFLALIFFIVCNNIFAQNQQQSASEPLAFRRLKMELKANETLIDFGQKASSLAIRGTAKDMLNGCRLVVGQDTIDLSVDEHSDNADASNLVIFREPATQVKIVSNTFRGSIDVHLFYAKPLVINNNTRVAAVCDKPSVVAGTTWRTGLIPPKEAPSATQVKHVIVHHAAGSNTATNYMEVVRNIYLYHTQSNGWNDVGYNFLIAQDGTIFEGRMGSPTVENDNALGAHFCGKNANTMGICLLGNYMTAEPTAAMTKSLNMLISWKLRKENIKAIGTNIHTGAALNNISGHRDGCSTDCPGDNVYKLLAQIRQDVPNECGGGLLSILPNDHSPIKIYPQPAQNALVVEGNDLNIISLHNILGQKIDLKPTLQDQNSAVFDTSNFPRGIYVLKAGRFSQKIILH